MALINLGISTLNTNILSWLNLYILAKFIFFWGKTFTFLAKPFYFLAKPPPSGKNNIFSCLKFYFLTIIYLFIG
jgi:hypothetical protein